MVSSNQLDEKAKKSERARDRERKRKDREEESTIEIPRCANPIRRRSLEQVDEDWLRYYCRRLFWYDFTGQQLAMITAIRHVILYGGDLALAASRGEGKSKLFERMLLKYTLTGQIKCSILFAATGRLAEKSLLSIRNEIETNELLRTDYPEAVFPVYKLQNKPNRAHFMSATGFRWDNGEKFENQPIKFKWCGDEVFFPRVPGSPSVDGCIGTRGLDAAVRGANMLDLRVDVAAIDDPDTKDTVASLDQAHKLEEKIDQDIAGLGSQQRPVSRIMLTTIQDVDCVSAWFTDPMKKPWSGRRYRFLLTPPNRGDLWDEYTDMWKQDRQQRNELGDFTDLLCRRSHAFLLANFEEMHQGAAVANPHRFDGRKLPDGSQLEVSALQHYFNAIAKYGQKYADCELNNDPQVDDNLFVSEISARSIQLRLSGYERGIVPPGCAKLTQGIDVKQNALHWVVKAWKADATFYVIDYGVDNVNLKPGDKGPGIELAIRRAIFDRARYVKENPYKTPKGKPVPVDLTLVDSGWSTDAVVAGCAEAGPTFKPSKGHGRSDGCATPNFTPVSKSSRDRKPGDGWFLSKQIRYSEGERLIYWLVNCDTDRWKGFEHARWMTAVGTPGAGYLFGSMTDEENRFSDRRLPTVSREHTNYSRHITAEIEKEKMIGGILRRVWHKPAGRHENHFLDASYLADVGGAMLGITLLFAPRPERAAAPAGGWFASQRPQRKGA